MDGKNVRSSGSRQLFVKHYLPRVSQVITNGSVISALHESRDQPLQFEGDIHICYLYGDSVVERRCVLMFFCVLANLLDTY